MNNNIKCFFRAFFLWIVFFIVLAGIISIPIYNVIQERNFPYKAGDAVRINLLNLSTTGIVNKVWFDGRACDIIIKNTNGTFVVLNKISEKLLKSLNIEKVEK